MLANWAPWIAVVIAAVATAVTPKRKIEEGALPSVGKSAHVAGGVALAVGIVLAVLGFAYGAAYSGLKDAGLGALIGSVIGVAGGFLGSRFDPSRQNFFAPIAFGALAIAASWWFPESARASVQLGAVFGLACSAWILGVAPTHWPGASACAAGATAVTNGMGTFGYGDRAPLTGLLLMWAVAIIGLLSALALPGKTGSRQFGYIVTGLFIVGAGWLVSSRLIFIDDVWKLVALGAAGALLTDWLCPQDEVDRPYPVAVSIVLWVAVATIAFSLRRGFGMAICLSTAIGMLALVGNWRAMAAVGPMAALCMYRIYKERFPDSATSLDIGQHYAMIGLAVGAAVSLLAAEWRRSADRYSDSKAVLASAFWAPILACLPIVAAIVLGSKGFVGMIAGLGFGTALAAMRGAIRPHAFAVVFGIGSAMLVEFGWLGEKVDLARDDKVKNLIGFAVLFIVCAALIAWLTPSTKNEGAADSPALANP